MSPKRGKAMGSSGHQSDAMTSVTRSSTVRGRASRPCASATAMAVSRLLLSTFFSNPDRRRHRLGRRTTHFATLVEQPEQLAHRFPSSSWASDSRRVITWFSVCQHHAGSATHGTCPSDRKQRKQIADPPGTGSTMAASTIPGAQHADDIRPPGRSADGLSAGPSTPATCPSSSATHFVWRPDPRQRRPPAGP